MSASTRCWGWHQWEKWQDRDLSKVRLPDVGWSLDYTSWRERTCARCGLKKFRDHSRVTYTGNSGTKTS